MDGTVLRMVAFIAAGLGIGLLALLITYLPTLYGAFSKRESEVALLEVRAGSPPTAEGMLVRMHSIGWLEQMSEMWARWEVWFADVEESHTSYPALVFFRSPQPDRHWITAAGTVLDTAGLTLSVAAVPEQPQAALVIRAGYLALHRIADFFGIEHEADPRPTDPISIDRAEFDATLARLATAGVPLREDREQAWRDFSGWRVNYDTVLLTLAELTMAPYAPWTSDRSAMGHRRPRLRRWGRWRWGG